MRTTGTMEAGVASPATAGHADGKWGAQGCPQADTGPGPLLSRADPTHLLCPGQPGATRDGGGHRQGPSPREAPRPEGR